MSGDICLDYIGTWRQEYFVSGVYNLKKFDFDQKTPGVGTVYFMAVKGLILKYALESVALFGLYNETGNCSVIILPALSLIAS